VVESQWLKTFQMRKDMNLQSGGYVLMPNHFHAIIVIGKNQYNTQRDKQRRAMHCVSAVRQNDNARKTFADCKNQFGTQSNHKTLWFNKS
jgi:hypothetical protein